jgi:hypothetical protein
MLDTYILVLLSGKCPRSRCDVDVRDRENYVKADSEYHLQLIVKLA